MLNQAKNMLIGFFVVVACGLIVAMILFVEPSVGDNKQILYIRFANVNGISLGTRVTIAGKPVGEITAITTIPNARSQPVDELGNIYYYQLTAHIDSHIKVYTTDDISIQTTGLLGERSILIMPKFPPPGIQPKLATTKTPLYAHSVDILESAFHQLSGLADKVEDAVDSIVAWIDQNGPALGSAVRSFDRAMKEFGDTMASVNKSDLIGDFKNTLHSFTATSDSIQQAVSTLEAGNTFENAAIAIEHFRDSTISLDHILQHIEEGKGTIGRMVADDDFYLKLMSIFSKIDTTMNDINHYGILFNLNKEWQRSRQKRATLLAALKTPGEFKEYFEKEVDNINTAMNRIAILIEKAEQAPEKQRILHNSLFRKDFAELLRAANELLENIRLYNEQLQESTSGECP